MLEFDRINKLLPLLTAGLIVFGIMNSLGYYWTYNVNIYEYLGAAEILILFSSKVYLVVFGVLFFSLFVDNKFFFPSEVIQIDKEIEKQPENLTEVNEAPKDSKEHESPKNTFSKKEKIYIFLYSVVLPILFFKLVANNKYFFPIKSDKVYNKSKEEAERKLIRNRKISIYFYSVFLPLATLLIMISPLLNTSLSWWKVFMISLPIFFYFSSFIICNIFIKKKYNNQFTKLCLISFAILFALETGKLEAAFTRYSNIKLTGSICFNDGSERYATSDYILIGKTEKWIFFYDTYDRRSESYLVSDIKSISVTSFTLSKLLMEFLNGSFFFDVMEVMHNESKEKDK